jgi:ribonucleotide monophosphatase NagD (HAD superfamily)
LYTDMEMANRVGCLSVLVLSGEATEDDANNSPQKIDVMVDSVDNLIQSESTQ